MQTTGKPCSSSGTSLHVLPNIKPKPSPSHVSPLGYQRRETSQTRKYKYTFEKETESEQRVKEMCRKREREERGLFLLIFRRVHSFGFRAKDASPWWTPSPCLPPQRWLDPPGNDGSQQGESNTPGDGVQGLNPVIVQKAGRIHGPGRLWTRGGYAQDHVDPFPPMQAQRTLD